MADNAIGELLMANIQRYSQNPTALFRTMLQIMEGASNGKYYMVDAGNPFAFLQEMSCMLSAANVIQCRASTRELYASLAETPEELYRHMSDKDHVGRFSTPAQATIDIWLSRDEVLKSARQIDPNNPLSVRRLTIARNTRVTVGGYPFTMQYPIDIIVKANNGISITYDTRNKSPFLQLTSNKVEWTLGRIESRDYIVLRIPMWQMHCNTEINALNSVTGFSKSFNYDNTFYYIRAFIKTDAGTTWQEIKTTHSDQIYDPNHPTVVLRVNTKNNSVLATVPQIYFNNGSILTQLRLDIYTTMGKVDMALKNFSIEAYKATWIDLDDTNNGIYRAPLDSFSDYKIRSDDVITGGSDAIPFELLRKRVIDNALDIPLVPLTMGGLESTLQSAGFNMVVNVDDITDREILATRLLPTPQSKNTGGGVGVTIGTVLARLKDWELNEGVRDNGIRMTITPSALFNMVNGVIQLLPSSSVNALLDPNTISDEQLVNTVNTNNFVFTPYFYVLDIQNETFSIRPYRLDKPKLASQFFMEENTMALVNVSSDATSIEFAETKDGWDLYISVNGKGMWSAFDMADTIVQLSYLDATTGVRYYVDSVQQTAIDPDTDRPIDNQYVYKFHLDSLFDVNELHQLRMTAAGLVELKHSFDLVYMVKNWKPNDVNFSNIDTLIDPLKVPGHVNGDVYLGLTHEQLRINFGDYLENLWRRSRSVLGDVEFVLNPSPTTYRHHPRTLYVIDPLTGNIAVVWNPLTEELESEVLHYQGDPVIDTPTERTDTLSAGIGDTVISFTGPAPVLDPLVRTAFVLRKAGIAGKSLVGACVPGPTANDLTLSVPLDTAILAGTAFSYGEQTPLAVAGERAIDSNGNYIPMSARPNGMKREFDLLLLDGRYYFTNDENSIIDKDEAVDYITSWLEEELEPITERLLERTQLFFIPTVTMGIIPATGAGNQALRVNAEQQLSVIYYMTEERFNNAALRKVLETSTPKLIAEVMEAKTISRTLLERRLADAASNDVVSVEVKGFNSNGLQTLTFTDPVTRPTIAKRLSLTAAGVRQVVESIDIIFERYDSN